MAKPRIQESREDYLERILMLSEGGTKTVKAVDLAKALGYSKPSISVALKKLEAEGFVYLGEHQSLHLTEEGLKIASSIYERHETLARMFIALGVSEETAYGDACRIEHDLSDETWEMLKKHYAKSLN